MAGVRSVTTAGQGPGEIAGQPAIAVTVTLRNGTATAIDLGQVAVTAAYGSSAVPAPGSDGPPAAPVSGTLAPGAAASGTYVFRVPVASRNAVDLAVGYLAGAPVVLFRGRLS